MKEAYLTRRATFAAAHRYWRDEWTEDRNRAVFGACANPHGHGHNFTVEVTVRGPIQEDTGFTVDLGTLDAVLHDAVVAPLDHQHINHAVPEFGGGRRVPTTENLAVWAWDRLAPRLPDGVSLHRVRIREDDALYADYFGGGPGSPP
ncbi:MAG: 6-carboxytetrahydropterin synthase [Gemmatimonadota bacterium]|jgi:6-pyruvoyltetrahydropterin/6-carboxytetrahydropterin synthase